MSIFDVVELASVCCCCKRVNVKACLYLGSPGQKSVEASPKTPKYGISVLYNRIRRFQDRFNNFQDSIPLPLDISQRLHSLIIGVRFAEVF